MEDVNLTQEELDFIEWLKNADEESLARLMEQTENDIFREGV